jgi:hypothetical protein
MVVAYFWAFNWETEDTKNHRIPGPGPDYSVYFYTVGHGQKQPVPTLVRAGAKEQEVHVDGWGRHIFGYALRQH